MREIAIYPITQLKTSDPLRAVSEVGRFWVPRAEAQGGQVAVWDVNAGVRLFGDWAAGRGAANRGSSLKEAIQWLNDNQGILITLGVHHFWGNPNVIQALLDGVRDWSESFRRLVVITPVGVDAPRDIARYISEIDIPLPDANEIASIIRSTVRLNGLDVADEEIETLAESAVGLTAYEVGNAVGLSVLNSGTIRTKELFKAKKAIIEKGGVLEFYLPTVGFDEVGGLENAKLLLSAVIGHPLAKGSLLLGVPGTGKTLIAHAVAAEKKLPLIVFNVSAVYGSLVGESEAKTREALKIIDSIGPCVVLFDEIEKGLAGLESSGRTDSGVSSRVFEQVLRWLNDRKSSAYVLATSNDVSKLPPEFLRAGRWDVIFFVDIPNAEEREIIARIHASKYNVPVEPRPDSHGWTGAEIEQAYRWASILGVDADSVRDVVPVLYDVAPERVSKLREWAKGRTVPASAPPKREHTEGRKIII